MVGGGAVVVGWWCGGYGVVRGRARSYLGYHWPTAQAFWTHWKTMRRCLVTGVYSSARTKRKKPTKSELISA